MHRKEKVTPKAIQRVQKAEPRIMENYSQILKLNQIFSICPDECQNFFG
jgi:hypothetical protein